jgi:serine/threonine protein kinase
MQENYFDSLKESMKVSRNFESAIKHTVSTLQQLFGPQSSRRCQSDILWPTATEEDIEFSYQANPHCDQNALELLRGLLQFQARYRWSPSQCLGHSFLKDANENLAEATKSMQSIISRPAPEKDALDASGEWLLYNVTRSAEN